MTAACYDEYHDQSGGCVFALVAGAVIAIVISVAVFKWAATTTDTDLPLTQHAQTSHAGQTWRAETIQEYMKSCTPQEYICPNGVIVRWCMLPPVEGKDPLAVGLFIGQTVRQVISGFAAKPQYWQSRGGCQ